jgi:hypothetical protein
MATCHRQLFSWRAAWKGQEGQLLHAAADDKPAVLVSEGLCLQLVQDGAGSACAGVCNGRKSRRGGHRGAHSKEADPCVPDSKGNRHLGSGFIILRVSNAYCAGRPGGQGGTQGQSGLAGSDAPSGFALKEIVIGIGGCACELGFGNLLQGVLQSEGKKEGPQRVSLANPSCCKHPVATEGVEGISPCDPGRNAAGLHGNVSTERVAYELAAAAEQTQS